jgi:hypothetical protein
MVGVFEAGLKVQEFAIEPNLGRLVVVSDALDVSGGWKVVFHNDG